MYAMCLWLYLERTRGEHRMRGLSVSTIAAAMLVIGIPVAICAGQASGTYRPLALTANAVSINESIEAYQGGIPRGDYQLTCRDIRSNGYVVRARCEKRNGGWRNTSLDYRDCRGGLINDDGNLRCGSGYGGGRHEGGWQGGGGWQGRGIPPGDYKLTCRNIRANGNRLDASCEKRNGNWRNTTLDNYDRCRSMIVNDDGHLRCGR
jgi:CVNH domain